MATRHGISRQRVRTVLGDLHAAAAQIPAPPALLAAVALLAAGPPARSAADATKGLLEAELAGMPLHPAVLLSAAGLFGLDPGFALRGAGPARR